MPSALASPLPKPTWMPPSTAVGTMSFQVVPSYHWRSMLSASAPVTVVRTNALSVPSLPDSWPLYSTQAPPACTVVGTARVKVGAPGAAALGDAVIARPAAVMPITAAVASAR